MKADLPKKDIQKIRSQIIKMSAENFDPLDLDPEKIARFLRKYPTSYVHDSEFCYNSARIDWSMPKTLPDALGRDYRSALNYLEDQKRISFDQSQYNQNTTTRHCHLSY